LKTREIRRLNVMVRRQGWSWPSSSNDKVSSN
jgi:hypothetical protein